MENIRNRLMIFIISIAIFCGLMICTTPAQTMEKFALDDTKKIEYRGYLPEKVYVVRKEIETDATIQTYDISKSNEVALGFGDGIINLYNADGSFQIAFRHGFGGSYALQFYEENILLYYTKNNSVWEFSKAGEILNIWEKQGTNYNQKVMAFLINEDQREENGNVYKREGLPTKFTKESSDGQSYIIYQAKHVMPIRAMCVIAMILIGGVLVIVDVYIKVKKKEKTFFK